MAADRIDYGNACLDDPQLVRQLASRGTPLTLCPLSNLKLRVVSSIEAHPLKKLMDQGLRVTINSEDPSYFGGYLNDNFKACQAALNLTAGHITDLARNSFTSAFVVENDKHRYLQQLDEYVAHFS